MKQNPRANRRQRKRARIKMRHYRHKKFVRSALPPIARRYDFKPDRKIMDQVLFALSQEGKTLLPYFAS